LARAGRPGGAHMTAEVVRERGRFVHVFPAENDPSWRNNAACLGVDSNVFFVDRGAKATEAKQICGGCPVREECLEYALRTRPVYGIWGGLNHNERWDVIQGRRARKKAQQ